MRLKIKDEIQSEFNLKGMVERTMKRRKYTYWRKKL